MAETTRVEQGDRVRIDTRGAHHGRHGEVTGTAGGSSGLAVTLDDGPVHEFDAEHLRPVPNVSTTLTEREHDTVTNIWGADAPEDVREMETETLWEMEQRVAQAVAACYEDDDMDALGILLSLDVKLTQVLGERQGQ